MRSLRARLLLVLLTGVLLSLLVGGLALQTVTTRSLRSQFRGTLLAQARSLAALVMVDQGTPEIESEGSEGLPTLYRVTGPDGETVSESGVFKIEGEWPTPRADHPVWSEVELPHDADGTAVTIVCLPHQESDADPGSTESDPLLRPVTVTVAASTGPLERSVAGVSAAIVGTGTLVLLATGASVWWGVRTGLQPLDRLAASLGEVSPDRPEPLEPADGVPAELRPVYSALDQMLSRLGETLERERRFTDAAAHELRTPLAELRTAVDVARRWPEPDRTGASLDAADRIVDRMSGLIEALLLLSRNPSEMSEHTELMVNLSEVVGAESARIEAHAGESGVTLTVSVPDPVEWSVSEPVGVVLVRNLLSNAVEYTPSGGRVEVSVRGEGGSRELRVSNGPVSLEPEQVGRLFEPFWRAQGSRTDQTHHGLGLAVVRHVCSACGLECDATLADRVLTLTVRPREESNAPERTADA